MTLFHAGNARFQNSEKRGRYKYSGLLEQEKYKYKPNNLNSPPFFVRNSKSSFLNGTCLLIFQLRVSCFFIMSLAGSTCRINDLFKA
jgi:hypothetical protein